MEDLYSMLAQRAYQLRYWSIRATTQAGSGHPTSCLSAADIVAVLFFHTMRYDPCFPRNPEHDLFILSKGHAAPLLYAAWYEAGALTEQELLSLRTLGSVLEGHPSRRCSCVVAATGSLGQGLSIGVGSALEARRYGRAGRVYVLMGDSECAEGSVWEAAELAAHYGTSSLVGILDMNRLGQSTETLDGWHVERMVAKWSAFGWQVLSIDGNCIADIVHALDEARAATRPVMIVARTIKGYGVARWENAEGVHGKVASKAELPEVLRELAEKFSQQEERGYQSPHPLVSICAPQEVVTSSQAHAIIPSPSYTETMRVATRKAYGEALQRLGSAYERLVVLDAEVKNSTVTELFEQQFPHRFYQCFVAEQNMIGMAVGMHAQGSIPFASTFGSFLTRAHDQLRMAAIGGVPVRVAGSHVGVSVGQDGPSQMALEDIALMRSLPESVVLSPADAISTYYLVAAMADYQGGISYIRLIREATPLLYDPTMLFPIGGYAIPHRGTNAQVVIIATGITVHEALHAAQVLRAEHAIEVTVVDCYCIKPLPGKELLREIARTYKKYIVVEDHYAAGGLGEALGRAVADRCTRGVHLAVSHVPCSGTPEELRALAHINADAIIQATFEIIAH